MLLEQRMKAKANKDWATSDEIRNTLTAVSYTHLAESEQAVQVFAPNESHKEYKVEQNDVQQAAIQAPKEHPIL